MDGLCGGGHAPKPFNLSPRSTSNINTVATVLLAVWRASEHETAQLNVSFGGWEWWARLRFSAGGMRALECWLLVSIYGRYADAAQMRSVRWGRAVVKCIYYIHKYIYAGKVGRNVGQSRLCEISVFSWRVVWTIYYVLGVECANILLMYIYGNILYKLTTNKRHLVIKKTKFIYTIDWFILYHL